MFQIRLWSNLRIIRCSHTLFTCEVFWARDAEQNPWGTKFPSCMWIAVSILILVEHTQLFNDLGNILRSVWKTPLLPFWQLNISPFGQGRHFQKPWHRIPSFCAYNLNTYSNSLHRQKYHNGRPNDQYSTAAPDTGSRRCRNPVFLLLVLELCDPRSGNDE